MKTQLALVLISDTERWVEIRPDSDHKVYQPGEKFLVIEEEPDGFLLCWRNGIRPKKSVGTLIHSRYVRAIT